MATARMYLNGLTTGSAGHNPAPSKRGEITGWTDGAVRRHTRWLYSVDPDGLAPDGEVGVAVTLTVRECPPTHIEWQRLRDSFLKRVRRAGAVRVHWVVEWQRRGVPHLHLAIYFPAGTRLSMLGHEDLPVDTWVTLAWLALGGAYGASAGGQHAAAITGTTGWLKYLSKHASRGVRHYQRTGKPEGWEKTGRLWGHTGDWPTVEPYDVDVTMPEFWRMRRLVRSWRVANARAAGDPRRIAFARRMLRCNEPRRSAVRGVSDWVPSEVSTRLLLLVTEGREVEHESAPGD